MKKFSITIMSIVGILSASSGSAFSYDTGVKIYKGGSWSDTYRVRLYVPSRNQPPADSETQIPPVKVINKTTITYLQNNEHETRAQRRKRALGHRYLGFVKQYRGYKYPF